mmetsp:Transcript_30507/g.90598  ORF Transcript_30507/g.90598 Transcript_30507/m.90598 type:complete len:251 (-) Transcript_30507:2128-2880(-)
MRSRSCPHPVPFVQSDFSSCLEQSRAPASAQTSSASDSVSSWWQPPMPSSDSVHGQLLLRFFQPSMRVSEQQRTSCSSEGSAQRAFSEHLFFLPHSTQCRCAAGGEGGDGDGSGGGMDASGGGGATREPQSVQSLPYGQMLYMLPSPPSSHSASSRWGQVLLSSLQTICVGGRGGGAGGRGGLVRGDGEVAGGGEGGGGEVEDGSGDGGCGEGEAEGGGGEDVEGGLGVNSLSRVGTSYGTRSSWLPPGQ